MGRSPYAHAERHEKARLSGVAKANSEVDPAVLEHCVRDVLNDTADRVMAVEDPLPVIIENMEGTEEITVLNNPNHPEEGTHTIPFEKEIYIERADFAVVPPPKYHRLVPGGMVRLKGAYILEYVSHEEKDGKVTLVRCNLIPDSKEGGVNAGIKVKGVVQWVPKNGAVKATLNKYESLLVDEVDGNKQFDDRINPNSLEVTEGALIEPWIMEKDVDSCFQFMRSAYYKLAEKTEKGLLFYRIVGLKDSFNKK